MFKKDTRRGLALGAAFSLVASLFGAAPAALADETSVVVTPMSGTSNTMLITEDFVIKTRLGNDQDSSKISNLKYFIEKPAGYNLSVSNTVSSAIGASAYVAPAGNSTNSALSAAATNSVMVPLSPSTTAVNQLRVQLWSASALTSVSPAIAVTITAFLDIDPDGIFAATEPHEVYTVNFAPWSTLAASVTLATPVQGADEASATATVTGVNLEQLDNDFVIQINETYQSMSSNSAALNSFAAANAMSFSVAVSASAPVDSSMSATLFYDTPGAGTTLKVQKLGVSVATIDDVTVSPVAGSNIASTGHDTADSRLGAAFSLKAWAYTGSTVVAGRVPTFTVTSSAVALSATKYLVINGVTYTQSSAATNLSKALTAGTDGKGTINVQAVGFINGESLIFTVAGENDTSTFTVTPSNIVFSVSSAVEYYTFQAGTTNTVVFNVVDQFGVLPASNDQTVVFSIAGDAVSTSTQSVAVVSGVASVTVTPKSATATGSYVITPNLRYAQRNGIVADDSDSVIATTVYVQTDVASNSFTVKPALATYSASISYGVALSYSADITVNVANTGSSVVISSPGLIIHSGLVSASDTLTVVAGAAGVVTFKATSRMAGTYTVSLVAGTGTASTQIVVAAAGHDAGSAVSYDVSELLVGKSSTVTGTLVDANGNPVATGTTGSIVVAWTGGGLPFNLPTDTDAKGEFEFQVLVLSTEVGEAAVSVTYRPNSVAVDTKNKTFASAIDLVTTLSAATAVQKITVGTYKGYVAVFTKGYEGQKLSVRLASKWHVVNPIVDLAAGYSLKTINTGVGYVANVIVYIDGVEVKRQTITTK